MKQKRISEITGISGPLLSMIKKGKRGMSYTNAKKLKELTGKPVEFWIDSKPSVRWEAIEQFFKTEKAA